MLLRDYLVPYLISNAIALTILLLAFRRPAAVKWIWAGIFVWAAAANSVTVSADPRVYLVYGALTPSDFYRDFIQGWFSRHIQQMVLSIAVGQIVLAALLVRADQGRRRLGVAGAVIFLLAIAPLGVGSAFPFSLTAVASLLVMEWRIEQRLRRGVPPAARFIPHPDAREDHTVDVHAPSDVVFDVARHVDLQSDPLVAALIRVRAAVMGDRALPRVARGLVPETLAMGWGVLSYTAGRTLVMGAVAQPWARDVTFSAVEPSQFESFAEPDLVKIVWTIETEPLGASRTRFRTETRVEATDAAARRRFRRYWSWVSPGVRLIRWRILRALKREAERRHRQEHRLAARTAA